MKRLMMLAVCCLANAQEGTLDLMNLHHYANQPIPAYVTRDNTPADNPITDEGATLGRVMFYDRQLSTTGTISCASCHQQEHAFGDLADSSVGVAGTTGRHSMRLINSRFSNERRFFWDERAATLEEQTSQPIQDHVEMGFSGTGDDPNFTDLTERMSKLERYEVLFRAVFSDAVITEERVQKSLAQFIRSIQSFDSKYDDGRSLVENDNAPFPNFTAEENQGKVLFMTPPPAGGAGCAGCHQPPAFDIDPGSRHNGVTGSLVGGQDLTNTRSPSLRDVVDGNGNAHGQFMHNAAFPNLLAVVNHYNAIPAAGRGIDPRLAPGGRPQRLNLTEQEKASLVSFLRTLTGSRVYTDERWSDPFDQEGALSMIVLPSEGMTITVREEGGFEILSQGVPHVDYLLQRATDLSDWDEGVSVICDEDGLLRYSQSEKDTAEFFRFVYKP